MRPLFCVCAASLLSAGSAARAQIYNPQSVLATEADEGLSGALTAAADWRTGNTDYLLLSAAPVGRFRAGQNLFIGVASADYKTSRRVVLAERYFEHLRYRRELSERLLGEAFAQHEFNSQKRLQLRALVGAGPRLQVAESERAGLGVGLAYMLEYERLQADEGADAGAAFFQHRASSYLVAHYQQGESLQWVETLYYQPRLIEFSDARVLSDSRVVVKAGARLSFSTSFSLTYDSSPPAEIDKLDTALISSITYEL